MSKYTLRKRKVKILLLSSVETHRLLSQKNPKADISVNSPKESKTDFWVNALQKCLCSISSPGQPKTLHFWMHKGEPPPNLALHFFNIQIPQCLQHELLVIFKNIEGLRFFFYWAELTVWYNPSPEAPCWWSLSAFNVVLNFLVSPGNHKVTLASFYRWGAEAEMLISTEAGSLTEAAKVQHKSLDTYPHGAPFHNHKLILLHYRATEKTKCHNIFKPQQR